MFKFIFSIIFFINIFPIMCMQTPKIKNEFDKFKTKLEQIIEDMKENNVLKAKNELDKLSPEISKFITVNNLFNVPEFRDLLLMTQGIAAKIYNQPLNDEIKKRIQEKHKEIDKTIQEAHKEYPTDFYYQYDKFYKPLLASIGLFDYLDQRLREHSLDAAFELINKTLSANEKDLASDFIFIISIIIEKDWGNNFPIDQRYHTQLEVLKKQAAPSIQPAIEIADLKNSLNKLKQQLQELQRKLSPLRRYVFS